MRAKIRDGRILLSDISDSDAQFLMASGRYSVKSMRWVGGVLRDVQLQPVEDPELAPRRCLLEHLHDEAPADKTVDGVRRRG